MHVYLRLEVPTEPCQHGSSSPDVRYTPLGTLACGADSQRAHLSIAERHPAARQRIRVRVRVRRSLFRHSTAIVLMQWRAWQQAFLVRHRFRTVQLRVVLRESSGSVESDKRDTLIMGSKLGPCVVLSCVVL